MQLAAVRMELLHPLNSTQLNLFKDFLLEAYVYGQQPESIELRTPANEDDQVHLLPSHYGLQVCVKLEDGKIKAVKSHEWSYLKNFYVEPDTLGGEEMERIVVEIETGYFELECDSANEIVKRLAHAKARQDAQLPVNLLTTEQVIEMVSNADSNTSSIASAAPGDHLNLDTNAAYLAAPVYMWTDPTGRMPEDIIIVVTTKGIQLTTSSLDPLLFFYHKQILKFSGTIPDNPEEMELFQFTVVMEGGGEKADGSQTVEFCFECEADEFTNLGRVFEFLLACPSPTCESRTSPKLQQKVLDRKTRMQNTRSRASSSARERDQGYMDGPASGSAAGVGSPPRMTRLARKQSAAVAAAEIATATATAVGGCKKAPRRKREEGAGVAASDILKTVAHKRSTSPKQTQQSSTSPKQAQQSSTSPNQAQLSCPSQSEDAEASPQQQKKSPNSRQSVLKMDSEQELAAIMLQIEMQNEVA